MKKALFLGLVILGVLVLGSVEAAYAQAEGGVGQALTSYHTYRMDFFKSQREANMPSRLEAAPVTDDELYYKDSPVTKGSDGFINASTGWSDLPAEVAETSARENVLSGITFGLGRGLVSGITRTTAGVVDMVTCAFPPYDQPLADPQYQVEDPNRDGYKVALLKW